MKIDRFDGGLSVRLDPSLIESNEATIYNNIDSDIGVLKNTKDLLDANKEARGYFYSFGGVIVSSYLERSYVEYDNKLYFSENTSYPKKITVESGIATAKRLGIVAPITTLNTIESAASSTSLQELDISANGAAARDLYITTDGYLMFVLDETNDQVDKYELSTAWDITTAEYINSKSISAQETNATGLTFKPNGTKFYIVGNNKFIYEYTMTTAWDVTTATFTTSKTISAQNTTPQGLFFNSDGTKLYTLDGTTSSVYEYTMATAYSLSVLTYNSVSLAVGTLTGDTNLTGLFFKSNGKRLYVSGYLNDKIYEFTLETAWDLSTAVYYGSIADISTETTQTTCVFFSPDMLHMYVTSDPTASKIEQYDINRISSAESTLQYLYTYYNSTDDVESSVSGISEELSLEEVRSVTLTGFARSDDTQVDKIRIYRIGDNTTSFTLVEEIDMPDDISSFSYIDDIPTTDLEDILTSQDNYPAKDGLRFMVEAYGILFAALDNKLYFCKQGQPDAWPEDYYIIFNKTITGLLPVSDGLLVFMNDRTDILTGTTISEFNRRNLSKEQGCVQHLSGRYVQGVPIWQSYEGFCAYTGSIQVISKNKLGKQSYSIINSAVYDETYFACLNDGTLLALDVKFNDFRAKRFSFSSAINNIYVSDGLLYGCYNTDRLCYLFNGVDLPFTYKSPVFKDDDYSNVKTYKNIYIRANGEFEVKIYIDDELVETYNISGNNTFDLNVPQEKQKGFGIQFEITGIGIVYEYEYKVMERQNGR